MSTLDSTVIRDQNRRPIWWGVSSVDGVTLVPIQIDSTMGGVMVEDGTSVLPSVALANTTVPRDGNRVPSLSGETDDGSKTILPVSVNPATGAILIQTT